MAALFFSTIIPTFTAYAKSPFDSGYDYGCDDARISNPSQQYINQSEKGPSCHTSEFMDGYYSGLSSCGGNIGGNNYQEPQQTHPPKGFKDTLNYCKDFYSDLRGMSDTLDTGIGLGCTFAGGLSEITK